MPFRGIRGAITVRENTRSAITEATRDLLREMVHAHGVARYDVASVIFTATADLDAAYPAVAAREMGWTDIPLLCMQEMAVVDSLPQCVRVLLHWNTDRSVSEVRHVYLGGAAILRPDIVEAQR